MVAIISLVAMKLRFISATLCSLVAGLLVAAPASSDSITSITTNLGRSYQNCRVCQVDPDGVIIAHQKGMAKLLFSELPDSLRSKLGYDAQKAADHVKEVAESKRRAQELRVELQKEMIKAHAAVNVAALQSGGFAQPSYGMGGGYMDYPGWTGGLYGWDNSLFNGGYPGPVGNYYGRSWNNGCWGTPGGTTLQRNLQCGTPILNVISTNRGGFFPGGAFCRPANNFFAVPPLRNATPALSGGFHGGSVKH